MGLSSACRQILERTSHLSIEEEIMVWSLWRAYLFFEIRKASKSPMLLEFVLGTVGLLIYLFWYLRRHFADRVETHVNDFGDDGDDNELDLKV
jgi:hypothetical protein